MRKAQNVVKFGLKLGAFAALAATLSSCLLVITDDGTPRIDSLVAQSTYCEGAGAAAITKIDFRLNATNVTVESFDAVVSAIFADINGNVGDDNVTDPTTQIDEGPASSTNITTIPALRISGVGTLRSFTNLTMSDTNKFGAKGTVSLTNIQPKITPIVDTIRLWVRASYSNGKTTGWIKSAPITPVNGGNCDPSGI
jgi:hypothetical protein